MGTEVPTTPTFVPSFRPGPEPLFTGALGKWGDAFRPWDRFPQWGPAGKRVSQHTFQGHLEKVAFSASV